MPTAPTKDEVAEVVEKRLATLGVDVPMTAPAAFVERMLLLPRPVSDIDALENAMVPVAVIAAAVRLPEKRPLPWTESDCDGEVVEIPREPARYVLPIFDMVKRVVVEFAVEEPIAKRVVFVSAEFACTESFAYGEEDAM